jgi:hypothetical protein
MTPQERSVYYKAWRLKNKEARFLYVHKWHVENKEHLKEYYRVRNQLLKFDVQRKLRWRVRQHMRCALRIKPKKGKTYAIEQEIGCSLLALRSYLEERFQPGMGWHNYGDWTVDHIRALALFDLADPIQYSEVCHYTNLQPLWLADNLKKGMF